MTHCYTDFLLLCALGTARKNEALADALTNTDALLCGCLTEDTLIHGLTVLQNEGYISLPGGEADADTVCLLTAKGRQAIAVPVLNRLFGRRDAALFAREDAFLAAPAGNGETTVVLRPGAFDTVHSRLLRAAGANGDYDGAPWITVARCEGGMAVTLRVPGEEGTDESDDSAADRSSGGDSSSSSDSNGGGLYDGAAPEDALAMSDSVRAVYPDGLSAGRFTDLLLAVRDFFCGKPQVRKAVEFVINIVLLAFFAFIVYYGFQFAATGASQKSPYLMLPMTYYYYGVPISGILMFYYMLEQLIDEAKELFGKKGDNK